jgi:hypothetical protein
MTQVGGRRAVTGIKAHTGLQILPCWKSVFSAPVASPGLKFLPFAVALIPDRIAAVLLLRLMLAYLER